MPLKKKLLQSVTAPAVTTEAQQPVALCPQSFGLVKALYSVDECAEILSISRAYVYILVNDKQLAITKLGARSLIAAIDIAEFIQKRRETSAEPAAAPKKVAA